jgi:hypothetical protein
MKIYRTTLNELRKVLKENKLEVEQKNPIIDEISKIIGPMKKFTIQHYEIDGVRYVDYGYEVNKTFSKQQWQKLMELLNRDYIGAFNMIGGIKGTKKVMTKFNSGEEWIAGNLESRKKQQGEIGLKYIRAIRSNRKNSWGNPVQAGFYVVDIVPDAKKTPKKINIYGIGEAKGHGEMLAVCDGFKPKLPKELQDVMFVSTIDGWGFLSIDEVPEEVAIIKSEQEFNEWLNEMSEE